MSFLQTIRSLVQTHARLLGSVAVCAGLCLMGAAPAAAQGHGGGEHGGSGMMGRPRGSIGMRAFAPVVPPVHIGLQLGLGGRWWDEGRTVKKLTLRSDQQRRMDDIFEANRPTLQALYSNLQHEEEHLAALPPGDLQDESKVFAAIDRVSQARTDLEKANAHVLVQIRQQLDTEQLDRLDREIASSR